MSRARVAGALVAVAVAGGAVAGCEVQDVTAPRVQAAVSSAFARLYVRQQALLGRAPRDLASVGATAQCARGAKDSRQTGPGDDWRCVLRWVGADGALRVGVFDLTVRGDGCYAADGPPDVVGGQVVTRPDGRTATNPLLQFDGCLPRS